MKTTNLELLKSEYQTVKDSWKDIYQWGRIKSKGNTEIISAMLLKDFDNISWVEDGLRKNLFKIANHEGYCYLQTEINQFTEKRYCRALYNEFSSKPNQVLGKIIDYETPLTAPEQGKTKINQGDIDLIALRDKDLLFIEAKTASSTESLLKAILEIYVYTVRLFKFHRIKQLRLDFKDYFFEKYVPAVLTFFEANSGKQILEIEKYPNLLALISRINKDLKNYNIKDLQFYIIQVNGNELKNALRTEEHPNNKRLKKIFFKYNFSIQQFYPDNFNDLQYFENKLDAERNAIVIKGLLYSFNYYQKQRAIEYCKKRLLAFISHMQEYRAKKDRSGDYGVKHNEFFEQNAPFMEVYIKLIDLFSLPELQDVNIELINPYQIKNFKSYFSKFQSDKMLDKLISLYENIRIVSKKDNDGISQEIIDLEDEEILAMEICKYDDNRIIPTLKKSIIQGKMGVVKRKVIDKLLIYESREELLLYLSEYYPAKSFIISALTNKTENAEFAIKYINES